MTDEREIQPEPAFEEEPEPETRTVQELVDEGYVGFIRGSDGFAIVDPILPVRPEEVEKLRWRFDF